MLKKLVGVYYADDPICSDKLHRRQGNRQFFFENLGIRKVINDIDVNKYEVFESWDKQMFMTMDFVLISLQSYYDMFNVLKDVPDRRKAQIIVGGQACMNITPIIEKIDVANFGRCDNGLINRILNGEDLPNVWRKINDRRFEKYYAVGLPKLEIEQSIGCQKKCNFCSYSWWNRYETNDKGSEHFTSNIGYENFIQKIDWKKYHRSLTAIDGCNEVVRQYSGKRIKTQDIIDSLLRTNETYSKKSLYLKIQNMYGLKPDTPKSLVETDLIEACNYVDKKISNRLTIWLNNNHFTPMPKTPLAKEKVDLFNYRETIKDIPILFKGDKIKMYSGYMFSNSPSLSCILTVANRIGLNHPNRKVFIEKTKEKKFFKQPSEKIIKFCTHYFSDLICEQNEEPLKNIITPYSKMKDKIESGFAEYYKR